MHCIWNLFIALYYCVWVMRGVQGLVMVQNILFLVPCVLKKNPQLNDPFPATDFGLCFPCEIIVFGHGSSV